MKKVMCLILLAALGMVVISTVYAQDTEMDTEEMGMMPMKMGKMKKGPGKEGMGRMMMVTPEQVAGYNDETKAAWREIEDLKIRKRSGTYLALASALAISIAVLGGALAQGKVAAAAMEGIARNPEAGSKLFTPLIISLALIESLVIYAWIIALWMQGKV